MKTKLDWSSTALVIVDPQIDVLSSEGVAWDLIGDQVTRLGLVDKLVALRDQAEKSDVPVFYSRLEISENDFQSWKVRSPLQALMAERRMMLSGAGGRFHPALEPTAKTVLLSPRRNPSPIHSDMAVQLRQRGIETILLAGMIANLCLESHVREAIDGGFNALVVTDAMATTNDATLAATVANFGLLATETINSTELLAVLESAATARATA